MRRKAFPAALALLLLLPSLCFAAEAPAHIDRLARVGKLWGTVRYLHPYLAYRDIDWDAALVAAIPRVREAKTVEEYRAAVQGMLDTLGDPATLVIEESAAPPAAKPDGEPKLSRKLEDGLLVIELAKFVRATGPRQLFAALRELEPELGSAGTVVLDLRGAEPGIGLYYVGYALEQLTSQLVSRPIQAPAQRYLLHSGYRPQVGSASGGYFSGFINQAAEMLVPAAGREASPKRVVFLLDETIGIQPLALALQAAGDGRIIFEGSASDASAVTARTVDLGEGIQARVRVSEVVPFPGWRGVRADVEIPKGASDRAFEAAVAEARREWAAPAAAPAVQPLPDAVYRLDKTYPEMKEPQGTAWDIAPRINRRNAKIGAQFRRSLVTATSEEEAESGFYFSQPLPGLPPGASKYTAPTVMIIDDRAISQSEHSGLFFEMASGTKFVGTATAGANGDITSFTLPGGIQVGFTGHDVRHADGRQLQRVGLIPDVEIAPTRAGLKAGRDELLDKAVEVLEGLAGGSSLSREAGEGRGGGSTP